MSGPTLPDLKNRIGVDYEEISRALVGKSIGSMFGCVIGGFIHQIFVKHTDLINTFTLLIMALAAFIIPWSISVPMAGFAFILEGLSEGLINTGCNTAVMNLWGEKSAPAMHSLHFGFGLGALLSPQIARPFLSPEPENTTNLTTIAPEDIEDLSKIEIPYSIAGSFSLFCSILSLVFYIKGPPSGFPRPKPITNFKKMTSPGSCTGGHTFYGIIIFATLIFYFFNIIGGEVSYGSFLFAYGYESGVMDKNQAANLQTIYWFSYTGGRFVGIGLTAILNLHTVMMVTITNMFISSLTLAMYSNDNATILTIFTAFLGFSLALNFPNGMSWSNLHLRMNSLGVMVIIMGASCGAFLYQYVTGYLFENQGTQTLMYIMVASSMLTIVSFMLMSMVIRFLNPVKNSYNITDVNIDSLECYDNTIKDDET